MNYALDFIGDFDIEAVEDKVFIFQFQNPSDCDTIINHEPWHFDRQIIILQKPDGVGDIKTMDFRWARLSVYIHNIPLICTTKNGARIIIERLGHVVQLPTKNKECYGLFTRIKVRIDAHKLLLR